MSDDAPSPPSAPEPGICPTCKCPIGLGEYVLEQIANRPPGVEKAKDLWDKAGVVGQLLSGVLIGALGLIVSLEFGRTQRALSADQLEISHRTQVSDYVKEIATHQDVGQRAELLSALDLAISADQAVPIAMHYAVGTRTCDPSGSRPVFDRSIQVLQRIKEKATAQLRVIQGAALGPDGDIASAILGGKISVKVRVSQVNDSTQLQLNQVVQPDFNLTFGQDSGWVDITNRLAPGSTSLILVVTNCSARLEVSAGTQQFDSSLMQSDCQPGSPRYWISGSIEVQGLHSTDGSVRLFMGSGPWAHDSKGCPQTAQ